jgi:hypothetical protein
MWKKKIDFLRVNGKLIKCPICDHDQFWKRKTLLNTSFMTMLGFDWANRESQNFVCDECGHVLWFLDK